MNTFIWVKMRKWQWEKKKRFYEQLSNAYMPDSISHYANAIVSLFWQSCYRQFAQRQMLFWPLAFCLPPILQVFLHASSMTQSDGQDLVFHVESVSMTPHDEPLVIER